MKILKKIIVLASLFPSLAFADAYVCDLLDSTTGSTVRTVKTVELFEEPMVDFAGQRLLAEEILVEGEGFSLTMRVYATNIVKLDIHKFLPHNRMPLAHSDLTFALGQNFRYGKSKIISPEANYFVKDYGPFGLTCIFTQSKSSE